MFCLSGHSLTRNIVCWIIWCITMSKAQSKVKYFGELQRIKSTFALVYMEGIMILVLSTPSSKTMCITASPHQIKLLNIIVFVSFWMKFNWYKRDIFRWGNIWFRFGNWCVLSISGLSRKNIFLWGRVLCSTHGFYSVGSSSGWGVPINRGLGWVKFWLVYSLGFHG